jgi:hypothetical protein
MASRTEEMRDYLISKGMDPDKAQAQAERSNRRFNQSAGVTGAVASGAMLPGVAAEAAAAPTIAAARQWLMSRFAPAAAKDAVLMEPAAGAITREAITRGTMMNPMTAGATIAAGAPAAMPFLPRRAEGDTGANTPLLHPERGYDGDSPRERIAVTAANDILARQREAADSGLLERADYHDENAVPNPQRPRAAAPMPLSVRRPAELDAAPQQGFLGRMFSGDDYQSNNQRVVKDNAVNWGDRDNAADFFRADAARMAMEKKAAEEGEGKAKGGAVAGKDAAIHKALEIIHHLLTRGR